MSKRRYCVVLSIEENIRLTRIKGKMKEASAKIYVVQYSLPGSVLVSGLTESWISIGLFIGTYLNWKIIASRLRKMSAAAGDSITIPEYFQNRFGTKSPVIRFVCAAIIFVFFLVYTASAFSSGAC